MPLQLRRGNAADLAAITPSEGELVYVRPTGSGELPKLYVGDGSTAGGILVAGYDDLDAKDAFAASIAAGTQTGITFNYNSSTKAMDATVDLSDYDGVLKASAFNGSLVSDSSTILVDAVSGSIPAEVVVGTFTGDVVATTLITNSVSSLDSSEIVFNHIIRSNSDIIAENEFVGNLRGDVTGNVTGDLYGNLRTPNNNLAYDREINTFYPDFIELQGFGGITSSNEELNVDIENVTFLSEDFKIYRESYVGILPWINISQFHENADADNLTFARARGTFENPQTVQNGDDIIDIAFSANDGTINRTAAAITVSVIGAVSTNIVPTRMTFQTHGTTAASIATRLSIDSTKVQFSVVPQLPVYANETVAVAAIGTPANGMMYYDTLLSKVRAYAGGAWVNLH